MSKTEHKLTLPIPCGHCGNVAPMEIVAYHSMVTTHMEGEHSWDAGNCYDLVLCPSCGELSFRKYFWHEGMESEEDVTYNVLFPSAPRLTLGLPEAIKKAYTAALRVKPIDSNAFGVLIGRTIEMVCIDRNATGRFLGDKIQSLAKMSEIPDKIVKISESLGKFRNVGAHAELGELTNEEVPIVNDICCAILEYVYGAPFLAKKAEEALFALQEKEKAKQKHE